MTQPVDPLLASELAAAPAPVDPNQAFLESGTGQGLTALLGAGRAATLGLSDLVVSEGANILGGEGARKDTLKALQMAKEANPGADLAGEVGGLFLNPFMTEAGAVSEAKVVARVGEGLLGKVAAGAGRGAVESALLGAQHSITEDTLGDHALNGEKMFATMGKEALLGAGIGGAVGAAGYGLGRLFGGGAEAATGAAEKGALASAEDASPALGPYRKPGPMSASSVEEVLGQPGVGKQAKTLAEATEEAVESLRKTGLTSDQSTELVQSANKVADAAATAKDATSENTVKSVRDWYMKTASAKNPDRLAALQRLYEIQTGARESTEDVLRTKSATLSKKLTSVFRDLEDTANELQFGEKTEQMRRLMKDVDVDKARDATAAMWQEAQATVHELNSLASKGGKEGSLKTVVKNLVDFADVFQKPNADAADFFMAANRMKQLLDKQTQFAAKYNLTEGEQAFKELRMSIMRQLEDESVWGAGGRAQAALNKTYSDILPRRAHLVQTVGQSIDRGKEGVQLLGGDFQKMQGLLRSLTGHETDAEIEGVKSLEAFIDGQRARIAAVEEHASLSAEQAKRIAAGKAALEDFAAEFRAAREEVSANNQLRALQLEEKDARSLGGLIGLVGDAYTKPLTTIERLAEVKTSVDRLNSTVRKAAEKVFKASAAKAEPAAAVTKETTEKEIQHVTSLAGSPERMAAAVEKMFGKLSSVAPKISTEAKATAMRALTFLAKEAPIPVGGRVIMGMSTKPVRYSDAQLAQWQAKREAAFGAADGKTAPEVILRDMQRGRLNRDALRTIEYVSPKLFAEVQQSAQEQIQRLAQEGKLDKLTLAQQASIASLLKVPPGEMWKPDFMQMMQAAKSYPAFAAANRPQPQSAPQGGTSQRAIKLDTSVFQTDAQATEGR